MSFYPFVNEDLSDLIMIKIRFVLYLFDKISKKSETIFFDIHSICRVSCLKYCKDPFDERNLLDEKMKVTLIQRLFHLHHHLFCPVDEQLGII